jgi:hypothetical protein
MDKPLDYRELLKKYMQYCESQTFVAEMVRVNDLKLSPEEITELERIEDELLQEWINE